MYIKKANYDNALRRVKIEFGTLIGLDEDKEAYVTLKELDTMTILKFKDVSQSGNQSDLMEFFKGVLPKIIVTHNLYETETKLMSNEDVANFIYEKLELTTKVMSGYTSYMFRSDKSGTDGDKVNQQDAVPETT
jgi:hypothetical protein